MLWNSHLKILKRDYQNGPVVGISEKHGNILTFTGASAIWECLIGKDASVGLFDSSTQLGAGTSNHVPTTSTPQPSPLPPIIIPDPASATGLLGGTGFATMDSGFPQHTDSSDLLPILIDETLTITFQATFDNQTANFLWMEAGVFNSKNRILNRFVSDDHGFGEKTGGWWTLIITITLMLPVN